MPSDINTVTNAYFNALDPSLWDFASYENYIREQLPNLKFKFSEANSRFLTALRQIHDNAASLTPASARAQFLRNEVRQNSQRRKKRKLRRSQENPEQPGGFVNHGRLTIAPGSTFIENQLPPNEGVKSSRRLGSVPSRTPTLSGFEEDQTDQDDEAEEQDECDDEYMEESSTIPPDTHHGWNDTDSRPITNTTNTLTTPYNDHRLDTFRDSFSAMRESHKRIFTCSGRVLENLIHTGVTANPANAGDALDWVIDLKADGVHTWFSEDELNELRSWLPSTPKVDEFFTYARNRYNGKSTIIALRETAESKPTPPDTIYDREHTFNATYVNAAVTSIISTIEQSATNESIGSHREGWYGSNIWSSLLDHCMSDLDDFTVSRTDIASKVGCSGRRFDAIFLAGGVGVDLAEVGAVEVSRSVDVLGVGKRQGDQGKLRELMKEMVKTLWKTSKCDDKAGRELKVVGVQQVGFKIRISTMCAVSRGVFVLQPGKWRAVPQTLENFERVFDVLQAIVVMKAIVRRTVEVLRDYANVQTNADGDFKL